MTVNLRSFLKCLLVDGKMISRVLAVVFGQTCKYKNYLRTHFTLVLSHGSLRVLTMLWMIMSNI